MTLCAGVDIEFLRNSTIKLHKQIILYPKPDLYHNPEVERWSVCIVPKNFVKFSNLTSPHFSIVANFSTKAMFDEDSPSDNLIQATTDTRTRSKDM